MFTRNWYKFLAKTIEHSKKSITVKNLKNEDQTISSMHEPAIDFGYEDSNNESQVCSLLTFSKNIATGYRAGIVFGNGDTPVTYDDYTLAGTQFTTFTGTKSLAIDVTEDKTTYTALYTLTNTGESPFTIKEIGLIGKTTSTSSNSYLCLLERTLLDEPITIEPQGVGQVTYTITFNFPTPA